MLIRQWDECDIIKFFYFGGQLYACRSKRGRERTTMELEKYNICANEFKIVGAFQVRQCYFKNLFLSDFFGKYVYIVIGFAKEIKDKIIGPYLGMIKVNMESYSYEEDYALTPCKNTHEDFLCHDQQHNLLYILNKEAFMTYSLDDETLLYKCVSLPDIPQIKEDVRWLRRACFFNRNAIYIFSEREVCPNILSVKKFDLTDKSLTQVCEHNLGDYLARIKLIPNGRGAHLYIYLGFEASELYGEDEDTDQYLVQILFSWEKESLEVVYKTGVLQHFRGEIVELPSYFFHDDENNSE